MKNLFLICVMFLFISTRVSATEQILEEISIGDNRFGFYQTPLSQLINDEEFEDLYEAGTCSGAWRGYKGSWSISSGKLYLFSLERDPCGIRFDSCDWRNKSFDLTKLFPKYRLSDIYIEATWYSGEIVIPIGESRGVEGKKSATGHHYFEEQVIVYVIEKGAVLNRNIEYRER